MLDKLQVGYREAFFLIYAVGFLWAAVLTARTLEYPQQNMITQEVENWSYSDQKIRLHIPVGVSYNSDMHHVKKLLLQAVDASPRILPTPKPVCLMSEFADSSVNFELRCWIEDPEQGIANVKSEIYFRIWDLFKENSIEIPFPQRDLNFKPEMLEALVAVGKKVEKKQ